MRIGEVSRRTGLTVRTLRHYDDLGLVVASERSSSDYRLYTAEDLERLLSVQHLKSLGLSLDEIGSALDDPTFDVTDVLRRHIRVVEDRIADERDLLGRLRALQSTLHARWDDVVEVIALTEKLRHPDPTIRLRAALDGPTVAPLETLIASLRAETDPGVREVLTWSIVQHGDAAVDPVIASLRDPDPGVRSQMAHILSKLRDVRAVAPLGALFDDPVPGVRAAAAFALGQIGGAGAVSRLISALGEREPLVGDAATAALMRTGREAVVPLTAVALHADRPLARRRAVEALGSLGKGQGDDGTTLTLVAALHDEDAQVRFEALVGLGGVNSDEAGRAIAGEVNSPDERTRLLARRLQNR